MRILAIAIVLVACAGCATSYQSKGLTGGFSETEVQPGIYQVKFNGNGYTSSERAADFALLRGAELCLGKNAGYMLTGDQATSRNLSGYIGGSSTTTTNGSFNSIGSQTRYSGTSTTNHVPPTPVYKPQSGLTVACVRDQINGAWDAQFLVNSLRDKYKLASN